jgi:molybdopterin-containing oxidoreductase family membrane subunit
MEPGEVKLGPESEERISLEERIDPATGEFRVIASGQSFQSVTEKISRIVLTTYTPLGWLAFFGVGGALATMLLVALTWLFLKGVGIWAITQPVAWGFAIINLFKQGWRNSINRFAEAMTIFAVVCAGTFPLIHLGRPWLAYWVFPLPLTMNVWPQFRSPLMWDVFAVSTYATISVVFWYIGMVPDFGTLRDRAKSKFAQQFYGLCSLGWRGSARHWSRYETASLLLAGLATPLVLSVHTVISFDFAVAVLPGWHTTIFPPYFVAGAIYSGFAMVLTLAIPLRKFYHLEGLITERHIDNMGKVLLATGFIVAYGYGMEVFMSWYSASHWEAFMMWNRVFGPMGWSYWVLITCNLAIPLTTLWSRRLRSSMLFMFCLSIVINTGMWFERFVIIVTSLSRDFLPSAWGTYRATKWDYMVYAGTLGLFLALFMLFVRFLPMIPISEIRTMLPGAKIKIPAEAKTATEAGD